MDNAEDGLKKKKTTKNLRNPEIQRDLSIQARILYSYRYQGKISFDGQRFYAAIECDSEFEFV